MSVDSREVDALASMMGADSRRIDELVLDVGQIKGDVRNLDSKVSRVDTGVDALQQSMAILNRHAVLMETQAADIVHLRGAVSGVDKRVQAIEVKMPTLEKSAGWIEKGGLTVVALVGAAVLALVIKR